MYRNIRSTTLLSAASRLIETEGLLSFRFSQLARESRMSNTSLYALVANKEEILARIAIDKLRLRQRLLMQIAELDLSGRDGILLFWSHCIFDVIDGKDIDSMGMFFAFNRKSVMHCSIAVIEELQLLTANIAKAHKALLVRAADKGELSQGLDEQAVSSMVVDMLALEKGVFAVLKNVNSPRMGLRVDKEQIFAEILRSIDSLNWKYTPLRSVTFYDSYKDKGRSHG